MATFLFPLTSSHVQPPHVFFSLIELDVVGREQAGFAAEVAEPPVVVGEFLEESV
jgi:hypothetical protein